jgi:two-component system nitrogen regulation response regulator GlnG
VCQLERDVLIEVLRETGGNKARAARMLQIDYKTIHTKIREYGLST